MISNKPQLTISILASNRPDSIRRCLDSLGPITEAISCELILIDTSKNPLVHEILSGYTDLVYEFEWCNDFAKARNEGMRRAKGEWFLFLDDDEWFVETKALVEFFNSGEYKKYGYANYQVRNFLDERFENYSDCWVTRMVCLEKDTRFVSKIHEYIDPLRGKKKNLQIMANHTGYVLQTQEKRQAHFERNSSLLLEMIQEEPANIRWRTHLIQEYTNVGEWKKLEAFCNECLDGLASLKMFSQDGDLGTIYVGLVLALINQKKYSESISICRRVIDDTSSSQVLRAFMHLKLGESLFRSKNWDKAICETKKYLEILNTTNLTDVKIIQQLEPLLIGDTFGDGNQRIAFSILICSELEKNSTKVLSENYERLGWEKSVVRVIEEIEYYIVKAMWNLPYEPIFASIMADVLKNRNLRELFCKEILLKEQIGNKFQEVIYFYADAMQHVLLGPVQGNLLAYETDLNNYVQAVCQWYDFLEEQELIHLLGDENPAYIQATLYISEYFELEGKDAVQALGCLKNAVELFPDFATGIGAFIHGYTDLDKQREEQKKREMEALRVQVVDQVKTMLANGQMNAALQVISQLKRMFPEDLEVAALALETRIKN